LTTGFTNDSTVGAAVLGVQAAGGLRTEERYEPETRRGTPPPSKNSPLYRERFQRYLELYQATTGE
jgi:sugar (pentulose or hexulose) kinase